MNDQYKVKTQNELQELKEKIAEKRKGTFEMACLDDYLSDIEKLPKDLLKLLKSNDYCQSEGCFQTAKKNQKAYRKELENDTGIG